MNAVLDCIPCLVRQMREATRLAGVAAVQQEWLLRRGLRLLVEGDWTLPPPCMAQQLQRLLREATGINDPYRRVKQELNDRALKAYPSLKQWVTESEDPFAAAVCLAVDGNLLDCGAMAEGELPDVERLLRSADPEALREPILELRQACAAARHILYLADNAGEIVLDRLLLERLPADKVVLAVRGAPAINDATLADAEAAGLTSRFTVVDNGSDIPGTVLDDTSASFREHFDRADLVIAKGQGNYETLSDVDKNIFFLFRVKCPAVASRIGRAEGSRVVVSSRRLR